MRIFDIFNKQLSRPLLQAEKTVEEFRRFVEIMDPYIPNSVELTKNVKFIYNIYFNVIVYLSFYIGLLFFLGRRRTRSIRKYLEKIIKIWKPTGIYGIQRNEVSKINNTYT